MCRMRSFCARSRSRGGRRKLLAGLSGERIRSHALAELPGLSWLAVNVRGSTASVEVRAAVEKPEITDPGRPQT